jgi:hypothetical protein
VSFFEATFDATANVPYHVWVRMRSQANSLNNDSVSAQFSDSVDAFGSANYRIGTPSGAEFVLQDGASGSLSGWGWADNGFGNFGPDIYFASTGSHTIRVQVRTDGTIVDQIVVSPDTFVRASPGAATNDTTILSINGMASVDGGTGAFTLIGDAGDIWGAADAMYFAYQPLDGDGSIVARLTGAANTNVWARAGVMIRESMAANAANAFMFWAPGKVTAFQRRPVAGGPTFATLGSTNVLAPRWLRIDRAGGTFTAYQSIDGVNWTFVGSDTIPMASTVLVGLGGASANAL